MPPNLDQYVRLSDAPDNFNVSVTTLRRKRDKARDTDDQDTYAYFIVKTRDGEIFERPPHEVTTRLVKDGRMPEWFVDHAWLVNEYGARPSSNNPEHPLDNIQEQSPPPSDEQPDHPNDHPEQSSGNPDNPSHQPEENSLQAELIKSYTEQIKFLKEQLAKSQQREEQTLARFERLLPERTSSTPGRAVNPYPVDTTPKPQPVTQKPRSQPKKKTTVAPSQKQTKQRSAIARFLFGTKR